MKQQMRTPWVFEARHPRYAAGVDSCLDVSLEVDGRFVETAVMLDCSKSGIGLQISEGLPFGKEVVLHVKAASEGVDWSTGATVRWCRPRGLAWVCGCQFAHELAWERLGELMMSGMLVVERV